MKAIRPLRIALVIVGVLALAYCALTYVEAELFQASQARKFTRALEAHRKAPPRPRSMRRPPPARPRDGEVIARIEIPRIGLSAMVVEGDGKSELRRAAGHIPGTALPGEPGNVAIAAHRDTFFRRLRRLKQGDTLILSSLEGAWRYRVVSMRVVKPDNLTVLFPTGRDTLTLITCFPFDYLGSAPERFVVRAARLPGGD